MATVKVYKKQNDAVTSICGEPVKIDDNGTEYFELDEGLKNIVIDNNLIWTAEPEAKPADTKPAEPEAKPAA